MLSRIRIALGLAVLLTLFTSVTVLAKGEFSFIIVTGGELTAEVRISDPVLTTDFFTFADFYQNKTDAPVDPGAGYEITRYYLDGQAERLFDRLHYYPETGFVYYNGIVNGSSEYDGKWYIAQPGIKNAFETALLTEIRLMKLGTVEGSKALVPPAEPAEAQAMDPTPTRTALLQTQSILSIIVVAGLAMLSAVAFLRSRKLSPR